MRTTLQILERRLAADKSAYEANEVAKIELLNSYNIDTVDTKGDEFADRYCVIFTKSIELKSSISDIEQAIFYITRVINA